MTITLHTTLPQIELLEKQEDRPRSTARQVTVDRDALRALLMDHRIMYRELFGRSIVRAPEDPKEE